MHLCAPTYQLKVNVMVGGQSRELPQRPREEYRSLSLNFPISVRVCGWSGQRYAQATWPNLREGGVHCYVWPVGTGVALPVGWYMKLGAGAILGQLRDGTAC